jgi:tetratricopeptide (TPR) repeat protein
VRWPNGAARGIDHETRREEETQGRRVCFRIRSYRGIFPGLAARGPARSGRPGRVDRPRRRADCPQGRPDAILQTKTPADAVKLEALSRKGKFARVAATQLASFWVEQGDLDKAAAALAGIKESPKDFFYWQAKDLAAQIALLKGDAAGALAILDKIEAVKPKEFNLDAVLFHKAEALEKKGDKAAALALFKKIQADFAQSYFGYDAGLRARKLESAK